MRKTKEATEISKLRILLAAEEEFCKRGFVAANMDAIAKAVGMTKGAIFWHYKSKSDLFMATIKRATERVKFIFKEAFSSDLSIMDKFKTVIRNIRKDKAFEILMVLGDAEKTGEFPEKISNEFNKEISGIFKEAFGYLDEAKQKGEFKPDTDVRNILVPIALIMSGFAKIRDQKGMFASIYNYLDNESVIDAVFAGLESYQKKK
jgi:AcrR family transcriptional regulator